jgi:hypothetical protein
MKVVALFLPVLTLAACVNNSNLCPSGFAYSSQYDACLSDDAGSSGSSEDAAAPAETTPPEAGPNSEAAAGDASSSSGLGNSCNASSDCAGAAAYCLKSPTNPTAPGACTFTSCTPAECTNAYACCDCTGASLPPLQTWPKGICAPNADESQLTAFGCTCQ